MKNVIKRAAALATVSFALLGALGVAPSTAEAATVNCKCKVTEVIDWNNGNLSVSCSQAAGNFTTLKGTAVSQIFISATANPARAERFWSLATASQLSGKEFYTKCDDQVAASVRWATVFWMWN